ncbi:hypothetical protein TBLA_0G01260 [Henningerozyma blattae CBS 6284]|uniref:RanBD1 domain-containing protein n=1 Tax=Henningerozyma blattae (strain ATCC 34711 / CBS 6284 / DSM 70876 / NBRC 10599 / NRRL Y-10934 / UCD 77-7) TaxID=1071380 RepID=I2H6S1_HENB6|nr:hypothetical protein TBLA_0G01260 [Tetrapisispora blattae CBS 6284]CCH62073.1 hypothetical protein TBLA_0G01260 [Tetrapisispora blattae CBS 6284]
MLKRVSENQITKDDIEDEEDERYGAIEPSKIASPETMSKRKIAMPKRNMKFSFRGSNENVKDESKMANAFSFLNNKSTSATAPVSASGSNTAASEKDLKMKALNSQFKDKIIDTIKNDPMADLTPILEKYKNFMKTLIHSGNATAVPTTNPVPTSSFTFTKQSPLDLASDTKSESAPVSSTNTKSQPSDDNESSDDEIKVEGPTFTLSSNPTTNNSVFTFGKNNTKKTKNDDDSESDVEIKGPQFTFSGAVQSDTFKFKDSKPVEKLETKGTENTKPISKVDLPTNSVPESTNLDTASKNTFTFSAPQTSTSDNKADDTAAKPKPFFFGQPTSTSTSDAKPNPFLFNQPTQTEKKQESKPDADNSKLSFNFAPKNTDADTPKTPTSTSTVKPSFNFGNIGSNTNTNQDSTSGGSFKFSTSNNSTTEKNTDTAKKTSFVFGTSSKEQNKEELKPTFTFGSSSTNSAPTFKFGATSTSLSATPPADFKFDLPFGQGKSNTPTTEATSSTPVVTTSNNDETSNAEPLEESHSQLDLHNGEEDENVLFSQKAKLMIFDTEKHKYDSKGVGEMRLLQKKDDKSKIRFLLRSDGMGNILLNSLLVKSFNFGPLTPQNDNLVKTPVINADGKLITYVVKFKQKADGRLFVKAIDDAKNDM